MRDRVGRFGGWLRAWTGRLPGQLVLSHVFVAAVVLAFALGVAQVTFRHYFVQAQINTLTAEAQQVNKYLVQPYFQGSTQFSGLGLIRQYTAVVGTVMQDRVVVITPELPRPLLNTGDGNFTALYPNSSALVNVIERGHTYGGVQGGLTIVGVPIMAGKGNVAAGLFLEAPLSESTSTANTLTRLLVLGEIGAIIVVGALAYAIANRLSRPLTQLRGVVARSALSNDGAKMRAVEDEGPVEVQTLAHEFNRLQDRVDTQMTQLKREAEARDALLAHVAHDLRTPLTSIRGFLEAIRDGVAVDESHDRAVAVAWEETLRLQRLVNRLLKATRIRSEGGPMEVLSLRSVVEKTIERIKPILNQKQLLLAWGTQDDGPVYGNEDYLVEALLNVLDNAIKWSPPGSTIQVGSERRENTMIAWVRDEGPGIPEELLPRVFERFVTGDPSRQQSSGLGLSIVDEVARQHGGGVQIRSQVGRGATVELILPVFGGFDEKRD